MTKEESKLLAEIFRDAAKCHRLTPWENQFLADLKRGYVMLEAEKNPEAMNPSMKQWEVIRRIEGKVYQT
jgi:hypothetical protein